MHLQILLENYSQNLYGDVKAAFISHSCCLKNEAMDLSTTVNFIIVLMFLNYEMPDNIQYYKINSIKYPGNETDEADVWEDGRLF